MLSPIDFVVKSTSQLFSADTYSTLLNGIGFLWQGTAECGGVRWTENQCGGPAGAAAGIGAGAP